MLNRFQLSVMDRYIMAEILPPFLFGMGMFSSLGIAVGILFDLIRKITELGLPVEVALQVALLSVPQFILYAFPMSMLLATLMAYGQLSGNSELIAMRSVGVSVYRLVIPAIILSLIISGITFIFNDYIVPTANYQAAISLETALEGEQRTFQQNNIMYPEYTSITDENGNRRKVLSRLFYAETFDGKNMKNLTVLDRSQNQLEQIITAQSASWNIRENKWDFFNGIMYLLGNDGSFRNVMRFDHQKLQLPKAPLDLANRVRDNTEMSIAQSKQQLELYRLANDEKAARKLEVRIQQKIALPFACLVFGLVGAALGTRPQNANRATSFGISVLIIFSYYTLYTITGQMGVSGTLPPLVAAWITNVLGLGIGGFLLTRSAS
ncbi:LptF/LptG family permease [Spirulina sp. CS-785/01]|uniref:LptF/LptG family permease n=1 Tax=Spirulina sp. CS-785/01 TaxID=3021716 RepID=UPI00232BF26A|nr:LptF/LptG family permease [Spirulina sp. CS-785/01]MDB9315162.1 LptF/LptG family permease [Spirulina sp. CS-785/01]